MLRLSDVKVSQYELEAVPPPGFGTYLSLLHDMGGGPDVWYVRCGPMCLRVDGSGWEFDDPGKLQRSPAVQFACAFASAEAGLIEWQKLKAAQKAAA